MIKKFFVIITLFFMFQTNALANACSYDSIEVFDILNSWSKSLNKELRVSIPANYNYCVKFEKELKPKNDIELELAINSLNNLFSTKELMPLNICLFTNLVNIKTVDKDCRI